MEYESFRREVISTDGDFFSAQLEHFFKQAVDLAKNKEYDEALKIGNDALVLAKYSNAGYAVLYLIGMLCQVYLDNDQPHKADGLFKAGMKFIDSCRTENVDSYGQDINSFLDLKIAIDQELEKNRTA